MPSEQVLDQSPVVVVMFTLKGCHFCIDFKPRFQKLAAPYADLVPIVMADANDPKFESLANRLNVQGVPATFVLRKPAGMIRVDGAVPDSQVIWLLNIAAREMRYPNSAF
jgi:thiol-disulfide isomerase/thioredoxin